MKVDDRVRIIVGKHFYGPPLFMLGMEGTIVERDVVREGYGSLSRVDLDAGETFHFYDDEMQVLPERGSKEV